MKVLKALLVGVGLLVVVAGIVGFMLPTTWDTAASVTISAPPGEVYPRVATLSEWPSWTVWNQDTDPTLEGEFSGPKSGVGATWTWTAEQLGNGRLVINDAKAPERIDYELFLDGFKDPARGTIELLPSQGNTIVQWSSQGDVGRKPIGGFFVLILQGVLRENLEKNLARLKTISEAS